MGSRGPVKGTGGRPTLRKLPSLIPAQPVSVPSTPRDLAGSGRRLWKRFWQSVPWLDVDQHGAVVEELCRLTDELAVYRAALVERGPLLSEVITSSRGDVVGERWVANPAEMMARRAGAQMEKLWSVLGLTPAARARLGLAHLTARRTVQDITIREGLGK